MTAMPDRRTILEEFKGNMQRVAHDDRLPDRLRQMARDSAINTQHTLDKLTDEEHAS